MFSQLILSVPHTSENSANEVVAVFQHPSCSLAGQNAFKTTLHMQNSASGICKQAISWFLDQLCAFCGCTLTVACLDCG